VVPERPAASAVPAVAPVLAVAAALAGDVMIPVTKRFQVKNQAVRLEKYRETLNYRDLMLDSVLQVI
jgi:hypothetical protein